MCMQVALLSRVQGCRSAGAANEKLAAFAISNNICLNWLLAAEDLQAQAKFCLVEAQDF